MLAVTLINTLLLFACFYSGRRVCVWLTWFGGYGDAGGWMLVLICSIHLKVGIQFSGENTRTFPFTCLCIRSNIR